MAIEKSLQTKIDNYRSGIAAVLEEKLDAMSLEIDRYLQVLKASGDKIKDPEEERKYYAFRTEFQSTLDHYFS